MKSSITKRWVRGSLLFTLAVVLAAEGVFLFFMVSSYYNNARMAVQNKLVSLQSLMSVPSGAGVDERFMKMLRAVEQFDDKSRFEFMLVRANGSIHTTSGGAVPAYADTPADILDALKPGAESGEFAGRSENDESILAVTVPTPYTAGNIVAMRLVTSLELVDRAVWGNVAASVVLVLTIVLASVISGVFFIRSIVFPLRKVQATAARIAQGDFDARIAGDSPDEMGALCRSINNMAEELSKTERMKNEFISSVSHELRTPLTSIKGWTETVNRLSDPAHPGFRRGLEIIAGETDRLYEMVEELLDFSRMQDGLTLSPELLDMAAEAEEAVLLLGQRAAELGVALLYTPPEQPVPVRADKNRLRQVLVNVMDNAVKYSFPGGTVRVRLHADADGGVCAVVEDEGQGISAEDLENVKTRFYKGKGAVRGSGIGLAVVDEIMSAHGGKLQIESEPRRGTRVRLKFPGENTEENIDGEGGETV